MAKGDGKKKRRATTSPRPEHWKTEPDEHDYPAASDYLSLLLGDAEVGPLVDALKRAPITHRKAKDLLRSSRLALLDTDNPHVAEDLEKVHVGERLSPVLLVRGNLDADIALTVADGYHRICASFHLDENAEIPCRLVDRSRSGSGTRSRAPTGTSAGAGSAGVGPP
jgi:hypothetical protein